MLQSLTPRAESGYFFSEPLYFSVFKVSIIFQHGQGAFDVGSFVLGLLALSNLLLIHKLLAERAFQLVQLLLYKEVIVEKLKPELIKVQQYGVITFDTRHQLSVAEG